MGYMQGNFQYQQNSPDNLGDQFGAFLVSAGDINDDGFDDLAVFSFYDSTGLQAGEVDIFFGGSPFDTTADIILKENEISLSKDKVDVLVIGHGSMDPNAGISINYIVDELRKSYKNVDRCYLEIEEPNIEQGIQSCQNNSPDALVIVFYFLHEGAHVKTDINNDLKPALEKSNLKKVCVTKHLGADEKMIDLIVERAKEVENAN